MTTETTNFTELPLTLDEQKVLYAKIGSKGVADMVATALEINTIGKLRIKFREIIYGSN